MSGAFLADIKPQTDGCNGLKYNLTADIIECIFKTYPAVKRKHDDNVPAKLTESEFWTKFFQSHYFHRDRIMAGTKDLFTECGKIDDQALKVAVAQNAGDALLDLRAFEDNTLEDGFGGAATDKGGVNSGNIVHQNMIKRFNQHSTMVLNTCLNKPNSTVIDNHKLDANANKNDQTITTNGIKNHHNHHANADVISSKQLTSDEPKTKRQRILEKIRYDDLESDETTLTNGSGTGKIAVTQLNLTKIERYLHGPVPANNQIESVEELNNLEGIQFHLNKCTDIWNTRTPQKVLVDPKAAVNALGELTPGGALMRGFQEQSIARKYKNTANTFVLLIVSELIQSLLHNPSEMVPAQIENELRSLYLALGELLRHFWNSFPANTPENESKLVRMHEALQRFEMARLHPFEVNNFLYFIHMVVGYVDINARDALVY